MSNPLDQSANTQKNIVTNVLIVMIWMVTYMNSYICVGNLLKEDKNYANIKMKLETFLSVANKFCMAVLLRH